MKAGMEGSLPKLTFEKQYDTRVGVAPLYGGGRNSMHVDMLAPGGVPLQYYMNDQTPNLFRALKLDPAKVAVRHMGTVEYTDVHGNLKPDCRFCYQVQSFTIDGNTRKQLIQCIDPETNISR
jgi:hypothetical protein